MFTSIYIVRKLDAATSKKVSLIVDAIRSKAKDRNMFVLTDKDQCNEKTLVIAVGGDGTMLEALRIAVKHGSAATGVNLGRIGFLTDFSMQGLDEQSTVAYGVIAETFDDIFEFAGVYYPIEQRMMLTMHAGSKTAIAGNEVSISRDKSDSMITYRLRFNDVDAGIHRANSILVSSPMGSSAYSLSAGGALMMPGIEAMQVVPVAPLTMTSRPLIVGADVNVEVDVWGGKVAVRADGTEQIITEVEHDEKHPYKVVIRAYPKRVKILHNDNWNYFDVLSTKLGWIKE